MKSTSEQEKIDLKKRLARVLRVPSNKTCADCPEKRPTWISFIKPQQKFALGSKVLASFVCLECAALHRKLGTHICVVRSISHDQFEDKDVECAEYSGNEVVNEIFEGHLQKSTMDGINIKPVLGADVARRERFIRQKYVDLYFYRKRAHYQHISEVNKLMASVRKPFKSGSKPPSPTKPFRKKLKMFLHDENSASGRDMSTLGCSTTVGNTTTTNTSRTRTITDRDDSNRSDYLAQTRRSKKSSKKRSSKSGKTSNRSKKSQKKSTSQRRLKLKDQTDPMFGMPFNEGGIIRIGESSVPTKQATMRKDLKLKEQEPTNTGTTNHHHNDRERNDLSGMILVFDEDSFDSMESPQRERRSFGDFEVYRRSDTKSASSNKKPTIDSHKIQNDRLQGFTKKPLIKTTSEGCDDRDKPATSLHRRSRSDEITIDEISRKRDGSLSPGSLAGRKVLSIRNLNSSNDRSSEPEIETETGNQNSSAKKSNVVSPDQGTTPLIAHLSKDPNMIQNTSSRNLKIPYLDPSPTSPISVEGFISEETSYGFGDHTVNNMSGTGDNNEKSNLEDNSTINGFRVIDSETVLKQGSFTEKFKNKKETDGAIKSQSGRSLNRSNDIDAGWDQSDDYNEINKSNRSIGNNNNRSSRSIGNKTNMSGGVDEPATRQLPKSQATMDCDSPISKKKKKSSRSLTNKSNMSLSVDEPATRKISRRPKSQERMDSDSPPSKKTKKKKKKSSRSLGNKSNRSLGTDEHAARKKSSRSLSNKSNKSLGTDGYVARKKSRRPKSQENIDCDSPSAMKDRPSKKRAKKKGRKSRSKSTSKGENIHTRNRALLDEWERLKDENQREFERMRTDRKSVV